MLFLTDSLKCICGITSVKFLNPVLYLSSNIGSIFSCWGGGGHNII